MKRFLARAYWLMGLLFVVVLIGALIGMVLYRILFLFAEFISAGVAGLFITAFLVCLMHLWERCNDYLNRSDKDNLK